MKSFRIIPVKGKRNIFDLVNYFGVIYYTGAYADCVKHSRSYTLSPDTQLSFDFDYDCND